MEPTGMRTEDVRAAGVQSPWTRRPLVLTRSADADARLAIDRTETGTPAGCAAAAPAMPWNGGLGAAAATSDGGARPARARLLAGLALGLAVTAGLAATPSPALGADAVSMTSATPVKPAQYRGNLAPRGDHEHDDTPHAARVIDERGERALLGSKQAAGRLVELAAGDGAHGTMIVVHGMNSGPSSIQPVSDHAATRGVQVNAFVYNDAFHPISESGQHLADAIDTWRTAHPGQPLEVRSHSLGTRVALSALSHLKDDGRLEGAPIRHVMFGPPLEGMRAANGVRWAPPFLDGRFPGVSPGREMRPDSDFQHMIAQLTLPDHVTTVIVAGGQDRIVDADSIGFKRIADHLDARIILLPDADHHTVVEHPSEADAR